MSDIMKEYFDKEWEEYQDARVLVSPEMIAEIKKSVEHLKKVDREWCEEGYHIGSLDQAIHCLKSFIPWEYGLSITPSERDPEQFNRAREFLKKAVQDKETQRKRYGPLKAVREADYYASVKRDENRVKAMDITGFLNFGK